MNLANFEYIQHQLRTEIKADADGKCTCSIRGTARLADISESTLRKQFDTASSPAGLNTPKLVETLENQGFLVRGYAQNGIPDLAVASIIEYYAFDAGRHCTQQAMLVYRAMARIGIRAWMQDVVGYQKPVEQPIDLRDFIIKQLPYTPKQWECRFKPEFWAALEDLYGLSQGQQACGMFISHWVYGYFPKEVRARIDEINPRIDGFTRKNRIHQHFDDALLKALEIQISLVTCNLIKAKNKHHFKRLMKVARRYRFTVQNLQALKGGN